MTVAEPLGSAEDKSLELELGQNIHKLARGGAAFRQPASGGGETKYAELSQQVTQLTTIISDSVKKLPGAPSIS